MASSSPSGGRRPSRLRPLTARQKRSLALWPDEIRPGVRILIAAGVIDPASRGDRFIADVPAGTLGAYVGPHPTLGAEGWHLIDVIQGYVPLHVSQFERV